MFKKIEVEIEEAVAKSTPNGRMYETPDGASYPSVTTIMSYMSQDSIKAWRERVGEEEANSILAERPLIEVGCDFCGQQYRYDAVDAAQLFAQQTIQPPGSSSLQ